MGSVSDCCVSMGVWAITLFQRYSITSIQRFVFNIFLLLPRLNREPLEGRCGNKWWALGCSGWKEWAEMTEYLEYISRKSTIERKRFGSCAMSSSSVCGLWAVGVCREVKIMYDGPDAHMRVSYMNAIRRRIFAKMLKMRKLCFTLQSPFSFCALALTNRRKKRRTFSFRILFYVDLCIRQSVAVPVIQTVSRPKFFAWFRSFVPFIFVFFVRLRPNQGYSHSDKRMNVSRELFASSNAFPNCVLRSVFACGLNILSKFLSFDGLPRLTWLCSFIRLITTSARESWIEREREMGRGRRMAKKWIMEFVYLCPCPSKWCSLAIVAVDERIDVDENKHNCRRCVEPEKWKHIFCRIKGNIFFLVCSCMCALIVDNVLSSR